MSGSTSVACCAWLSVYGSLLTCVSAMVAFGTAAYAVPAEAAAGTASATAADAASTDIRVRGFMVNSSRKTLWVWVFGDGHRGGVGAVAVRCCVMECRVRRLRRR